MSRLSILTSLAMLISLVAGEAGAAITLSNGMILEPIPSVTTQVDDGTGSQFGFELIPNFSIGVLQDSKNGSMAEIAYELSDSSFDFMVDLARVEAYNARAVTFASIGFESDVDVAYDFSGFLDVIDGDGRLAILVVKLLDRTDEVFVFNNTQMSDATADESFILGQTNGDLLNDLEGSLTGMLLADHVYRLEFQIEIRARPIQANGTATALGGVTLSFLPEPAVPLAVATATLWLTAISRRNRCRTR